MEDEGADYWLGQMLELEQQFKQIFGEEVKEKPNIELTENQINLFNSKFSKSDINDCWIWNGSFYKNGYGHFTAKKKGKTKNFYAHRLQYQLSKGVIEKGNVIAHKCDTPSCVNPNHLFSCTQKENLNDMKIKNRSAKGNKHRSKKGFEIIKGEKIGNSKLKEIEVLEIRNLRKEGKKLNEIAEIYKVTFQTVSKIINHQRWRHI